jgi:hypothetical protein
VFIGKTPREAGRLQGRVAAGDRSARMLLFCYSLAAQVLPAEHPSSGCPDSRVTQQLLRIAVPRSERRQTTAVPRNGARPLRSHTSFPKVVTQFTPSL